MLAVRKRLKSRRGGRTHRRPAGARKNLAAWRLLAFLAALILLVIFLDHQIHPLVKAFGETQAKWTSTKAINEAVTQVLTDEQIRYEDLVSVARNDEGDIVSVEADISKINRLKAEITTAVLDRLQAFSHLEMRIPVGSILGGEMFNDRGPRIPLRATMSGNALTTMNSAFSSAGINQTSHQITLHIESQIVTTIPGYTNCIKVETSFVVAETVLVGKVPDSYTEVDGSQAELLGKIFAYGGDSK